MEGVSCKDATTLLISGSFFLQHLILGDSPFLHLAKAAGGPAPRCCTAGYSGNFSQSSPPPPFLFYYMQKESKGEKANALNKTILTIYTQVNCTIRLLICRFIEQ